MKYILDVFAWVEYHMPLPPFLYQSREPLSYAYMFLVVLILTFQTNHVPGGTRYLKPVVEFF